MRTEDFRRQQMRGIVGLTVDVARIEAAWKMSQNRTDADFRNIAERLGSSREPQDIEVSTVMSTVWQPRVNQPPVALPDGRKITNPSERVVLDALRTLWVERRAFEDVSCYPWTHGPDLVRPMLTTLQIPIEYRFQWDGSG